MADSALIRSNRPFFVPHFAKSFSANAAVVLHVDRLGKHIAPRFAHRYCLKMAPAIRVRAHDIVIEQQCEQHSALANSFDGALLLGDFIDIEDYTLIDDSTVTVTLDAAIASSGSLNAAGTSYRELISQLSVYFTLKMGDMIAVDVGENIPNLVPGHTLNGSLNGNELLTIRVK